MNRDLPTPLCSLGYTNDQVTKILGPLERKFWDWMTYKTSALCEGRRFNHATQSYEPACGGVAHGPVVYSHDLERFLRLEKLSGGGDARRQK